MIGKEGVIYFGMAREEEMFVQLHCMQPQLQVYHSKHLLVSYISLYLTNLSFLTAILSSVLCSGNLRQNVFLLLEALCCATASHSACHLYTGSQGKEKKNMKFESSCSIL